MYSSGDVLGKYTLVEKLGSGSFGVVWLAESRTAITTTMVALKIPIDDDIDFTTVEKEANLWVKASGHPNVLPIIEADIFEGQLIIASEYAQGGSLQNWLRMHGGRAPSVEKAVEITSGILAGLSHLHDRGIIHRDLKPTNILFQGEIPRLTDFGISRVLSSTTNSRSSAGTPSYMAPEAFNGVRDIQTDIWSVGVILFQMLYGHLPFPNEDFPSLIKAILFEPPIESRIFIPVILRSVVSQSLSKEADQRFESAFVMREKLLSMPVKFELMMHPKVNRVKSGQFVENLWRNEEPSIETGLNGSKRKFSYVGKDYPCKSEVPVSSTPFSEVEIEFINDVALEWCNKNDAYCETEPTEKGFTFNVWHACSDPHHFGKKLFMETCRVIGTELNRSLALGFGDCYMAPMQMVGVVAEEPRPQHYAFVHYFLRDRTTHKRQLELFVDRLRSEEPERALYSRWMTNSDYKKTTDELIPPDGLEAFPFELSDDWIGVVVKLPEPRGMVEAFFAAYVLPNFDLNDEPTDDEDFNYRFFTLELSAKKDYSPYTVFCEWKGESHENHGPGPIPEVNAFISAIYRKMLADGDLD